jgi:hypothetical protein
MQSYLMRTNYSSLINSPTFLTPLPILFRFSHSTNFLLNYLVLLIFFFMIILTNLKRISFVTLSSISPIKLETSSSTQFYSSIVGQFCLRKNSKLISSCFSIDYSNSSCSCVVPVLCSTWYFL